MATTRIYHLTCINNFESIILGGELLCDAEVRRLGIEPVRIGYANLKDRRMRVHVPTGPRGVIGDYVPFFFGPRPPMLYAIYRGFVEGFEGRQSDVVHLVSSAQAVESSGLGYAFTNGHAVMAMTDFFDDLSDLSVIDWPLMKARQWADTEDDPDRKRRRQAEFLVHESFPWHLIESIGVMTQGAASRVEHALEECSHQPPVVVHPEWYY